MNTILRHLRRAALGAGLSDGELLDHFVGRREEAAFELLLQRHGPMVLGVCRRLLGNRHDAEDAFQATFLVLVRKAGAIRSRETVGHWLYGVACRTALRARAMNAKRRAKEERARQRFNGVTPAGPPPDDWLPLLDEELSRLPEKYRDVIVLCDLQGKSRPAAARLLGWPVGTLSWRLAAGRKLLAQRLSRRGVALSCAALLASCGHAEAIASVPAPLLSATTRAALALAAGPAAAAGVISANILALTEGVVKTMVLAKLASVPVFVGVTVLGLTTGGFIYQTQAKEPPRSAAPQFAAAEPQDEKPTPRGPDRREEEMRRALEEARQREKELRQALEELRRELNATRKALEDARRAAEGDRVLRERSVELRENPAQPGNRPNTPTWERKVSALDEDRAAKQQAERAAQKFNERRQQLTHEMKRLDEEQQQFMQQFQRRREDMQRQPLARPENPPHAGPQLERLGERLEQIERRLDRLERPRRE